MPVLQTGDPGAIPGESTFHDEYSQQHGPVVQRRRLLAYTQATMVRVHPGLLDERRLDETAQVRELAQRFGLNPSVCRFDSCSGHIHGSVGKWQTTLA